MRRIAFALLGTLIACTPAVNVNPFLGEWTAIGEWVVDCLQVAESISLPLNSNLTISDGPAAGEVTTRGVPLSCNLDWTVHGHAAALINLEGDPLRLPNACPYPGTPYCAQRCPHLLEQITPSYSGVAFHSGTLVLNGNVIEYSIKGSGGERTYGSEGTCQVTGSARLARN